MSKGLDLIHDVLKPERTVSDSLLDIGPSEENRSNIVACRLLGLMRRVLSSDRLIASVGRTVKKQDLNAERLSSIFTTVLEQLLNFANIVREKNEEEGNLLLLKSVSPSLCGSSKLVHTACGSVLQALLGLLATTEFVKSVETLMERTDDEVRRLQGTYWRVTLTLE